VSGLIENVILADEYLLILAVFLLFWFGAIKSAKMRFLSGILLVVLSIPFFLLGCGYGGGVGVLAYAFNTYMAETIFGIISLGIGVMYLLWSARSTLSRRRTPKHKLTTRICPRCGKNLSHLPDDIKLCPYCGNKLR